MKCYTDELAEKLETFVEMVSESIPSDFALLQEKAEEILTELGVFK